MGPNGGRLAPKCIVLCLVSFGEGWMGPNGSRLAPECIIYSIWCHSGRVGWVQMEVGWRRGALYKVFGATWGGLDGSRWMPVGAGV